MDDGKCVMGDVLQNQKDCPVIYVCDILFVL